MDKLLKLQQCSHLADEACMVYCDRRANLHMGCADSQLIRITTPDGNVHFLWHNTATSYGEAEFIRVFDQIDTDPIDTLENVHPIAVDEVFCFNGNCYYLTQNSAGTKSILCVDVFCSQHVIEQISYYDFQPEAVDEIYMVKLYRIGQGKEFAYAAWVVERPSTRFHIPLFVEDGDGLSSLLDNEFYLEERVHVGDVFTQHGKYFRMLLDDEQKLHLAEGAHIGQSAKVADFEQPSAHTAKYVSLR